MKDTRFKNVVVGLLFVILFGIALITEQNVTMKEGIYNEKVINDVRESYQRICESFDFDFYEYNEDFILIGCTFTNEDGKGRVWTSFVEIEK